MGGLLDMLSAIFWVAALLGIGYVLVRVFGSSDSVDGLGISADAPGSGATSRDVPEAEKGLELYRYETVTVDDPHHLNTMINSAAVHYQVKPQYIVGMPQIASDGKTAQIPIYRRRC